jgi:hypothetical protein
MYHADSLFWNRTSPFLYGRAWVVLMNSFLLTHDDGKVVACMRSGQRLLFQEVDSVRSARSIVGSEHANRVLLAPPLVSHIADHAKRHPSLAGDSFTICYIGFVRGNLFSNNDMVLAFSRTRLRLGERVRLILVESTASKRTLPLTPDLLVGVDYKPHAIAHADALFLYASQCHLGLRVGSSEAGATLGTKVVEMAAAGLPSVVDNSRTNLDFFGLDYPYFKDLRAVAGSELAIANLASLFERAALNATEYGLAARTALDRAQEYTFAAMRKRVRPWLDDISRNRVRIVLVVGVRPNIVKAAAMVRAMRACVQPLFNIEIIFTGQHHRDDMIGMFFRDLKLEPPTHSIQPIDVGASRKVPNGLCA